jgi:hypothetical protein
LAASREPVHERHVAVDDWAGDWHAYRGDEESWPSSRLAGRSGGLSILSKTIGCRLDVVPRNVVT